MLGSRAEPRRTRDVEGVVAPGRGMFGTGYRPEGPESEIWSGMAPNTPHRAWMASAVASWVLLLGSRGERPMMMMAFREEGAEGAEPRDLLL